MAHSSKGERRQPRLAVNDEVLLHPARTNARTRREDHRANEVGGLRVLLVVVGELLNVVSKAPELRVAPEVGALVERDAVLLGTLE